MKSKENIKLIVWLTNPAIYSSLIAFILLLLFLLPKNNRIIKEERERIYVTTNKEILYGKQGEQKVRPAHTKLYAICFKGSSVIAEDATGNRFHIDREDIDGNLSELPSFNSTYNYYVKKEPNGNNFVGMHINDVVAKVGDYLLCDKDKKVYDFVHLVFVDGKNKQYETELYTNEQGVVVENDIKKYSGWNLYGLLPFYEDIVCLNIFNTRCSSILEKNSSSSESSGIIKWIFGVIWGLIKIIFGLILIFIILAFILGLPLILIFPLAQIMGYCRLLPNDIITMILTAYCIIVEYILVISFVEFSHSIWLISFPISCLIALSISFLLINSIVFKRCPQCRRVDCLIHNKTITKVTERNEYTNHSYDDKRVNYKGSDLRDEIWEGKVKHWTTVRVITTTEYHMHITCKHCGYSSSYNGTEVTNGPEKTVEHHTEKKLYKEV